MNEVRVQPLEKIHALTSMRFFAALYVVCFHTVVPFFPKFSGGTLLDRFLSLGYTSVSFFFLLSGYILGVVYLGRGTEVSKQAFFLARFARIYPLFLLTLVVDIPFLLYDRSVTYGWGTALAKTATTFAGNCFMLQAWVPLLRGIDNPNWSLSTEAFFYLTFPWIGVALWKLRGISFWIAAATLYLGGQAFVFWFQAHISASYSHFCPLLHLSTFALGILMARWQMDRRQRGLKSAAAAISQQASFAWAYLLTALAILAFAAAVYWAPQIPEGNLYDGLLAPIFVAVIYAFSDSRWLPARLLSASWLVVLGEASFGLYLIHLVVFHAFDKLKLVAHPALYPVYVLLCIGASVISFYFFETPTRRWLLRARHAHSKETLEMSSDAQ